MFRAISRHSGFASWCCMRALSVFCLFPAAVTAVVVIFGGPAIIVAVTAVCDAVSDEEVGAVTRSFVVGHPARLISSGAVRAASRLEVCDGTPHGAILSSAGETRHVLGPFRRYLLLPVPFSGLSKILSSSSHSTSLRNSYVPATFVFGCFRYVPTVRVSYHTRTNSPRESSGSVDSRLNATTPS